MNSVRAYISTYVQTAASFAGWSFRGDQYYVFVQAKTKNVEGCFFMTDAVPYVEV